MGQIVGNAVSDAAVGGARLIGILYLEIRVLGGESIERTAAGFLGLILQLANAPQAQDGSGIDSLHLAISRAQVTNDEDDHSRLDAEHHQQQERGTVAADLMQEEVNHLKGAACSASRHATEMLPHNYFAGRAGIRRA